jgi:hypothetical protein
MSERLHVFAVNAETGLRHTHLTRAQGEAPALPPLADWLATAVDTDEIELFPIRDLGDMMLSDYITMAFAPKALEGEDARRMNALLGHVLLVPARALGGKPRPGAALTLIASLPLAGADHTATLPKAAMDLRADQPGAPHPATSRMGGLPWLILGLALVALILLWVS